MQASLLCWMLLFAHTSMPGTAADVGYQLDVKSLTVSDAPKIEDLAAIEINDRTWAAPGLEEAADELGGDSSGWDYRQSGMPEAVDPIWTQEDFWPRTRVLWHRGEFYQKYRFEYVGRDR